MARIISIVNQKGGVGKTTTAINTAVALAHHGHRVLIVDLDPQANATSGLGVDYRQVRSGVYEALAGDVATSDVVMASGRAGVDLLPSTPGLAGATVELVTVDRREYRLADALADVEPLYDVIVIDCPPSLGLLTVNALTAAHEVLIPVQCEYYSLDGLDQLLDTIHLVRENLKPELKVLGIVLTMYEAESPLSHGVFHGVYQHSPYRVFRSVVPRHLKLAEAPSFGRTIFEHGAETHGARAYRRLAREILISKPRV